MHTAEHIVARLAAVPLADGWRSKCAIVEIIDDYIASLLAAHVEFAVR